MSLEAIREIRELNDVLGELLAYAPWHYPEAPFNGFDEDDEGRCHHCGERYWRNGRLEHSPRCPWIRSCDLLGIPHPDDDTWDEV